MNWPYLAKTWYNFLDLLTNFYCKSDVADCDEKVEFIISVERHSAENISQGNVHIFWKRPYNFIRSKGESKQMTSVAKGVMCICATLGQLFLWNQPSGRILLYRHCGSVILKDSIQKMFDGFGVTTWCKIFILPFQSISHPIQMCLKTYCNPLAGSCIVLLYPFNW
jgi:hypothetical protein